MRRNAKISGQQVAYKSFLILMVLFCAYMQWSPIVDFDYVWINGHEHYVGAANPHQAGTVVTFSQTQSVSPHVEDSEPQFLPLPVAQSAERLIPATTLRL
jgi:hypothetical protein